MDEIKMVNIDLSKILGIKDAKIIDMHGVDINDYLDEGWKVCDGTGDTIDLADRFIIGMSSNIIIYAQKI